MSLLTPEEKRRIYLEEKARLEAQEQLRQEQQQLNKEDYRRKRNRAYLIILGLVGLLRLVNFFIPPTPSPTSVASPGTLSKDNVPNLQKSKAAIGAESRFDTCKNKLEQLQKLEALYDFKRKGRPQVFLRPNMVHFAV